MRLPTVIIRDVLKVNSDEDIVRSLRTQNRHLSEGLDWEKPRAVSSPDKSRLRIRGAQRRPVWDQSPLVQCSRCLGYGHGKRFCKEVSEVRALRRGHTGVTCRAGMESPKMRKLYKGRLRDTAHGRSAQQAPWLPKTAHTAEGSSTEGCTDRVSLRFMQSNLQRSKLATTELLVEAARRKIAVAIVQEPYIGNIGELRRYPGCRVVQKTAPRRGPVKAAIMVLNSDVDVEEDQTLNGENVAAAVIKPETAELASCRCISRRHAHRPVPRSRAIRLLKTRDRQNHPGGDVNAWSVWWGSERNDARGVDLCDFLDSEGLHILNEGNTPRVYRGSSPQECGGCDCVQLRSTG
ncbi:hypothetical protein EVAR_90504_1 [Eumeta japonica]|uniref:Endonuclease/exonuclease/phosphatase domain-containing protein n=1 Tax=Eumeta variegata TaxID=151549 RepID=A0A4C2AC12_EUMVA|nr:hypothetical protein EVAR_90504_1 [Eumeta japonica]